MSKRIFSKEQVLFIILSGFFFGNALLAEFIGVKVFSLERSMGVQPVAFSFLDQDNLSFDLTAGVLLWPIVFIMTDVINEYFGKRGVRLLSFLAVFLILYAFVMVFLAIELVPAHFWVKDPETGLDMNLAFTKIFGQGQKIIFGSLTAFLIGQVIDASVFHYIRQKTGNRFKWARATGSTIVSQFVDTFVVLLIAFYWGANYPLSWVLAVGAVSYSYKFVIALVMIPALYLIHFWIRKFIGAEAAERLIRQASMQE